MTGKSKNNKRNVARRMRTPARRSPPRKAATDRFAVLVAATGQELALPIDPAWHAGVKFNLKLLYEHAARVEALVLPDEIEPAPVFRA
jgi:hypothetical protein